MPSNRPFCHAYCSSCRTFHGLEQNPAMAAASELMESLAQEKRIDLESTGGTPRQKFSTDSLYGSAMGKMFGVLLCRTQDGKLQTLKAFSGQFNGCWQVEGWAPPLFDVDVFYRLTRPVERQIKTLGRVLQEIDGEREERATILRERKGLSQKLMKQIHDLYRLHNFRGESSRLAALFGEGNGIPTGSGDCCAPKLLNLAAIQGLQPLGLAEFYWGRTNRSGSRHQGQFYPACADKCGPILGFLLCGVEKRG